MGSTSLQLAVLKRRIQQVAPPVFAFLKALNRRREQLWRSPLVYGWRGRCFVLKERCTGFPALRRQFFGKTGYEIDLKSPRTFNQKISWLKLQPITSFQVEAVDKARSKQLALAWPTNMAWSCMLLRRLPWFPAPRRFLGVLASQGGVEGHPCVWRCAVRRPESK